MLEAKFKWTDQNIFILQRMVNEGRSAAEAAAALGCSRNAAVGKATRLGTPFHYGSAIGAKKNGNGAGRKQQPWTDERVAKAAELYARNLPIAVIAREMHVRVSGIGRIIERFPEQFPKRVRPNSGTGSKILAILRRAEREEKAAERSEFGFDSAEFAIFGVNPIRFVDLTDAHCKFPISSIGDPTGAEMPCCGARRAHGSYCARHAMIAYGPGTLSERNALNGIGGRQ